MMSTCLSNDESCSISLCLLHLNTSNICRLIWFRSTACLKFRLLTVNPVCNTTPFSCRLSFHISNTGNFLMGEPLANNNSICFLLFSRSSRECECASIRTKVGLNNMAFENRSHNNAQRIRQKLMTTKEYLNEDILLDSH